MMFKLIIILSLLLVSCEDYGNDPGCEDDCGVCNGDNSTCSGCTNLYAENFDEDAIVSDENSCVFTYNSISDIFVQHCNGCHSAQQGILGGLDLSSYSDDGWPGNTGASVVDGDAENSLLYIRVENDEMPEPPASPLSNNQKNAIRQWINQGAN